MAASPPAGDALALVVPYFRHTPLDQGPPIYVGGPWGGDTISLIMRAFVDTAPPPPPPPGPELNLPGIEIPWGQMPVVDGRTDTGWSQRRAVSTSVGIGFKGRTPLDLRGSLPWNGTMALDHGRNLPWREYEQQNDNGVEAPWRGKPASDHTRDLPWDARRDLGKDTGLAFLSPGARDERVRLGYGALDPVDLVALDASWGNPPQKDRWHRVLWGKEQYPLVCYRKYEPPSGDAIGLLLYEPITEVGDGDHISLVMYRSIYDPHRCGQREPSGWRDAYFYRKPPIAPTGLVKDVYMILNTAYLTRLPERTAIDVRSMTMSLDLDSYCWTFAAVIGNETSLDLLRPTSSGPMLVEAVVNGFVWIMQIDSWRQGRSFGGNSRSVSGRSVSAQLGAPAAEVSSSTETYERTAHQLAEEVLLNTGFTLDWQCVDWLVPANVFSYQNLTPIQVIQAVAGAVGGVVQTHPETHTLIVQSRYLVSPWAWSTATPDLILPESLCVSQDGEWDARPLLNAAFVAGTVTGGISAKVTRQGTAGDVAAPMVTDALITHADAARERGRCIISAGGDWSTGKIELPVLASPDVPGLVVPGLILRIVPPVLSSWQCQTTGVSVSADWTDGGLTVRQMVDFERYHGA